MSQKAIIHTATRVIRRLTTDPSPPLALDETAIDLPQPIDIGGGPWKLDMAGQQVKATETEAQAAGLDEAYLAQQRQTRLANLKAALDDALANELMPARMRAVIQRFRELLD